MKKLEYKVSFNTPAFLGNAEQSGQWRTPPFKALLRQWWRVAYAADHQFRVDVGATRYEEGRLFGHAWLENDRDDEGRQVAARKSLVRMRLDRWDEDSLKKTQWPGDSSVTHPEVKNRQGETVPVGSALYLGYGPLTYDNQRRATTLKANAAIQAGESATLSIAFPTTHQENELRRLLEENSRRWERALSLVDRLGTLGGRSRNGWGSFWLEPKNQESRTVLEGHSVPVHSWIRCLAFDWPHAIGQDDQDRPLIWQTRAFDDWKALMRELAIVKIGLRTQNLFTMNAANGDKPIIRQGQQVGINHGQPQDRHWLSFPVTNHPVSPWGGKARLPNNLRFKVRLDSADPKKLRGVIFHLPCLPPPEFRPDRAATEKTWRQVHGLLDHLSADSNRSYSMIADTTRRDALKFQLDTVTLERISE